MCVTLELVGVFSSRKFTQNTLGRSVFPLRSVINFPGSLGLSHTEPEL